ncbi:uncharacterized protein LOC128861157 [Anastrepha ludens]|uniref:uncharacterized protein LOC128861157 n=1 Tax=Anastrepha ludens TaxID=28586 RepID=UPI0023AEC7B7|nr:uncharacterized protein LOC128861157 [Anastrepha ludens]
MKMNILLFRKQFRMQLLAALTCHIMSFSHGLGVGWMSPTVEILQSPETPLDFPVSIGQVSWIGSTFGFGFLIGNILFFLTVNRLSHRINMYLLALPHMLFWILIFFVQNVNYLYAGRFFAGLTSSGLFVMSPLFLSEILDKDIRGALMSMSMMLLSCGVLVGFILPTKLNYYITPCIALVFPILYYIGLCFFPETPQSLLKHERLVEAEAAFSFYKGIDNRSQKEFISTVEASKSESRIPSEFEEFKAIVLSADSCQPVTLHDFFEKSALKAFADAIVLCILYQLSGCFVILNYMATIFAATGSTMDPYTSTTIVGVSHIIGTTLASLLVERLGRRVLLFSSVAGMTTGMFGLGAFVQFIDARTMAQFDWVPLAFMVAVVFTSACGLFGNGFTIVVETLPEKTRSQALPILMGFNSILLIIIMKLYPYFLLNLGIPTTMYTTAGISVVSSIYLYIFLPETKGKSMKGIIIILHKLVNYKTIMVNNQRLAIFNKRYRMQILVTLTAHIMTLSHGIGIGWLSPTLLILQSPQTPLNFKVTVDDVSWIGSIFGLGSLCSNIFFGLTADRLGRKTNMYLLGLPHMFFWIFNYFAQSVEYLYVARFCAGLTSGGLYVIGTIFISEISDKEIRGALTSLAMMFLSCGILIGFTLPSYLDYHLIPCIIIFLSLIYLIILSFFPETPTSLLLRKQLKEAELSFNFYRNAKTKKNVPELSVNKLESPATISEFEELKASKLQGGKTPSIALHDFYNKSALKKFALAFVICIQAQFSSSFAFVNYMSHIFSESGSTMDPNKCTLIVGVVQIIGTLLASILVERFGRRTLMLLSTAGMALGMFFFGAFVQFTGESTKAEFNWVPLVAMAFVTATAAFGVISLTFTIIVEILPAKIRPQAQSIAMMFCSIMVFITLKLYPYFLYNFGISITMYSCAGSCVVTGIYLLIFLPETKGKSMVND